MTDIIAGAALAISIISFWVSWRGYQRDTGRLRLRFAVRLDIKSPGLTCYIANVGRRPVTIREVFVYKGNQWLRWRKEEVSQVRVLELIGKSRTLTTSTRLEEGQETEAGIEWFRYFDYVEVVETTGKVYRLGLDRKIKETFRSFAAQTNV